MTDIQRLIEDLPVFPVDDRGFYHNMMSLIISQRIRFSRGRKIREKIYKILNEYTLDRIIELTEKQRKTIGLSDEKWIIINLFHISIREGKTNFNDIKGIGEWTINCSLIMSGDYSCGFIVGDLAVRKKLAELLKLPKLTLADTKKLVSSWPHTIKEKGIIFSKLWNATRN